MEIVGTKEMSSEIANDSHKSSVFAFDSGDSNFDYDIINSDSDFANSDLGVPNPNFGDSDIVNFDSNLANYDFDLGNTQQFGVRGPAASRVVNDVIIIDNSLKSNLGMLEKSNEVARKIA
ncbi:hypothetical protein CR513_34204, partial [Mucuna pruriens]